MLIMRALWRGPHQYRGRSERSGLLSTRQLAEATGLSQREVWDIVSPRGKRWRRVA